ncbi:MAG: MarR family transcriptional regulator [Clostridiales bacterium]|nr:MarR family transcriptional regulator [Clostridiales bacterium]
MAEHEEIRGFIDDLFYRIRKIEENSLATGLDMPVSATEIHILEKIGPSGASRMGDIASKLGITLATLTVACDRLESKGLIEKKRSSQDKRAVKITLTDPGMLVYRFHEDFHHSIIDAVMEGLNEEEIRILGLSVKKLETFLETQAKKELKEEAIDER